MTKYIQFNLFLFIFASLIGCRLPASKDVRSDGELQSTDLVAAGNLQAADDFADYLASSKGCKKTKNKLRVILTGFGPFDTVSSNLSGNIVYAMADDEFWSGIIAPMDVDKIPHTDPRLAKFKGQTKQAFVHTREISIQNQKLDLCLIVLDVKWEVAAAIVVHEMRRFQPNFVFMMGQGATHQAVFETTAINRASLKPGYDAQGKLIPFNTPKIEGSPILLDSKKNPRTPFAMTLTWEPYRIMEDLAPLTKKWNLETFVRPPEANHSDYICNSLSYTAIVAAKGEEINLAGNEIRFKASSTAEPFVGFLHLPDSQYKSLSYSQWIQFVAGVIQSEILEPRWL